MRLVWSIYDITIADPELGNLQTIDTQAIVRRTPGAAPKVFRDDDWPVLTFYTFTWTALCEPERDDLVEFLLAAAGQIVSLTDYNGSTISVCAIDPVLREIINRDEYDYAFSVRFMKEIT